MKTILPWIVAACATVSAPGCVITSGGSDGDEDGASDDAAEDVGEDEPDLDTVLIECRGDVDVEQTTQIVADFDQSIHEMVACGGLTVQLCSAIVTGVIDAISQGTNDATPDAWTYDGEGTYETDSAMAAMTVRFYQSEDTSFGSQGDLLTENLFLASTYLVGARVDVDFDPQNPLSTSASLYFDALGPYGELLGLGANPQSPINVDLGTWDQLSRALGNISFDADIKLDDTQMQTTIRYDVVTERMRANALIDGSPLIFDLQQADAARGDLDQDLLVQDWGIDFVNGSPGALDGEIEFTVEGGPLDYAGVLVYDNSTWGTPELSCL